jgi:hypothetical protein
MVNEVLEFMINDTIVSVNHRVLLSILSEASVIYRRQRRIIFLINAVNLMEIA